MRLGLFGGSFDPPHLGHHLAALDAAERLGLDRVVWIPAAQQPLKAAAGVSHGADADARFAMVESATRDITVFDVDRIEIDRAGLSYTVATAAAFAERYPDATRVLLVGEDAWRDFDRWREPDRIRELCTVEVLRRHETGGPGEAAGRVVDVSSTEIRARVRDGRTVRGFVRDAVADIIERQGLYQW